MQEGLVMEIAKWFFTLTLTFIVISVAIFGIQYGQTVNFKQHVNYTIERNGGLTEQAVKEINAYSKENYKSRFTVKSTKLNQKLAVGEVVDYTINGSFSFPLFPMIPSFNMELEKGQATSLVR